jgi:hypothetical protein
VQVEGASGATGGGGDDITAVLATPLVGQVYKMRLRARDSFGNPVYDGGGKVEVKTLEPPVEPGSEADHILAPKLECVVHDNGTGTYTIDLTVARPGPHTVIVRLDGVEVLGSPAEIVATKPRVLASMKAAGKSRGETLYAVGAAIANAGINWAFKSWGELAWDRRDKIEYLMSVARMIVGAKLVAGLNTWTEHAQITRERRQLFTKAVSAIVRQIERRGLNAWIEFTHARSRNSELLTRTVGAFQRMELNRAFNTWLANMFTEFSMAGKSFAKARHDAERDDRDEDEAGGAVREHGVVAALLEEEGEEVRSEVQVGRGGGEDEYEWDEAEGRGGAAEGADGEDELFDESSDGVDQWSEDEY